MKATIGLKIAVIAAAVFFIISCSLEDEQEFQGATFFVISDIHYFAPYLGTSGGAFETYIARDRKMLAESEAILEAAVEKIRSTTVSFVLVVGDLSKDGELASHIKVAEYFRQVEEVGIKVYVIPGNHDIENPEAVSYSGDNTEPVPSVSPEAFVTIYHDFGYSEAISGDVNSLSYIAEPVPGLWLFALDSCLYKENTNTTSVVGGRFCPETLNWIAGKLEEARQNNKVVIVMMHHGIVEHWALNDEVFPQYTVDNWEDVSSQFADLGVKVVFTGHFHAQDIVKRTSPAGNFLFDVQTGSLVTYPCPYRIVELDADQVMTAAHGRITEIAYDTGEMPFQQYAENFQSEGLPVIVINFLGALFGFSEDEAAQLEPFVTRAMMAHFAGDEIIGPDDQALVDWLRAQQDERYRLVGEALLALWLDPPPGDNDIIINLKDGLVIE